MNLPLSELLSRYWSEQEIIANFIAFANIAGALVLGLLVGYERAFNGRAAGMRTYGLVCMASCALVVLAGSPTYWYGGNMHTVVSTALNPDPTRIIQGIVTGIGFLGAGVIMKDGFNIHGLTTSASIWASSAIGILVGIGFYATAILVTFLSTSLMLWVARLEHWLPAKQAISITLRFKEGFTPQESILKRVAKERGYEIVSNSLSINFSDNRQEWKYIAIADDKDKAVSVSALSHELKIFEGIDQFNISHARN